MFETRDERFKVEAELTVVMGVGLAVYDHLPQYRKGFVISIVNDAQQIGDLGVRPITGDEVDVEDISQGDIRNCDKYATCMDGIESRSGQHFEHYLDVFQTGQAPCAA